VAGSVFPYLVGKAPWEVVGKVEGWLRDHFV
jgi:hypothetical protein